MRRWMVWGLGVLCLIAGCAGVDKPASAGRYPEQQVQTLLSRMTLAEKVGQMSRVPIEMLASGTIEGCLRLDDVKLREVLLERHVGSILICTGQAQTLAAWQAQTTQIQMLAVNMSRLGIPVLVGLDTPPGVNVISDATVFPPNIAMGATANRDLVRRCAAVIAQENRAAGIAWLASPVLALARHPRQPYFMAAYSEDTHLVSILGRSHLMGLQGVKLSDRDSVVGCVNPFPASYPSLAGGRGASASLSEAELRGRFLAPFAAAVRAGALTVKPGTCEFRGLPIPASTFCLQDLLRQELGFKGFVVCDWRDIVNLAGQGQTAADPREAIKTAVMAGIDMCTVPPDLDFCDHLVDLVQSGEVPLQRIDEAVARILRVKYQLGLFTTPYADKTALERLDRPAFARLSYQAACESLVLLKNRGHILPLSLESKVLVVGPCAHSLAALCGAESALGQDKPGGTPLPKGDTIRQAIEEQVGRDRVTFIDTALPEADDGQVLGQRAQEADVIIACLGGASVSDPSVRADDLRLSASQVDLVTTLARAGKPVIAVLVLGDPRIVQDIEALSDALVLACLPGPEGGRALADVLFGKVNPSGRLPFTYARSLDGHLCYDHTLDEAAGFDAQWQFGQGLSYTEFSYRALRTDICDVSEGDAVKVTVEVINCGQRAGQEIVHLFLSDHVGAVPPAVRQLKDFSKIALEPGQSEIVSLSLAWDDFSAMGADGQRRVESGEFTVSVGGLSQSLTVHATQGP